MTSDRHRARVARVVRRVFSHCARKRHNRPFDELDRVYLDLRLMLRQQFLSSTRA
jgi:hypothetical protein